MLIRLNVLKVTYNKITISINKEWAAKCRICVWYIVSIIKNFYLNENIIFTYK